MKTSVYVDGYNLYYSRLKGTPWKWLDLGHLFAAEILHQQDPCTKLEQLSYFTAPIKASYARHGQESNASQTQYHRALAAMHPSLLKIVEGFHIFHPTALPLFEPDRDPSKARQAKVWMLEEKQTDVNLALHAYRDAISGQFDQVVICSNDSDIEPALKMIREDAPLVRIGLVTPLHPPPHSKSVPNQRLVKLAHWVRGHIRDEELAKAQMPERVATKKKPAIKPAYW